MEKPAVASELVYFWLHFLILSIGKSSPLYIRRMMMRLFGIPYSFRIFHKSSQLTESNALTRSTNKTWASSWCYRIVYRDDFNVNFASVLPFPNRQPHCSSIPKTLIYWVSLVAMIDDISLAIILPSAMPRHLFGFERSPNLERIQRPKRKGVHQPSQIPIHFSLSVIKLIL